MKVLFLGMGGIGQRHAANVRALRPNAELFAVRDAQNEAMSKLSVRCVPTVDDAIAESPAAAVVALPPALHAETAKRLIDARIPIYLEKPVATTVSSIADTADRAAASNIVTMVGCNLRMTPGFQALRDELASGVHGSVRHVRMSVGQWLPSWRPGRDYRDVCSASRALGGGVILELIHELDLARFLFGEYDTVSAQAGRSGALDIDTEDYADILLQGDGPPVNIHLDYLDRASQREGRIVCDAGTIVYNTVEQKLSIYRAESGDWDALIAETPFSAPDALHAAMAHFLMCVEAGEQTNQPLSEGVKSLALAEAAKRTADVAA